MGIRPYPFDRPPEQAPVHVRYSVLRQPGEGHLGSRASGQYEVLVCRNVDLLVDGPLPYTSGYPRDRDLSNGLLS